MDIFEVLLWLFTPIGIGTLLGIGAAALFCALVPPNTDCVVPGAIHVAAGFIVGLIWELAAAKRNK